jgi:hypothetical protein
VFFFGFLACRRLRLGDKERRQGGDLEAAADEVTRGGKEVDISFQAEDWGESIWLCVCVTVAGATDNGQAETRSSGSKEIRRGEERLLDLFFDGRGSGSINRAVIILLCLALLRRLNAVVVARSEAYPPTYH